MLLTIWNNSSYILEQFLHSGILSLHFLQLSTCGWRNQMTIAIFGSFYLPTEIKHFSVICKFRILFSKTGLLRKHYQVLNVKSKCKERTIQTLPALVQEELWQATTRVEINGRSYGWKMNPCHRKVLFISPGQKLGL